MAAAGRSGVVAYVRALASPDGRVRGALGMGGLGQASPVFAPLLFSTLLILGNDLPPPFPAHAMPPRFPVHQLTSEPAMTTAVREAKSL